MTSIVTEVSMHGNQNGIDFISIGYIITKMYHRDDHYFYDTSALEKIAFAAEEQVGIFFDEGSQRTQIDMFHGRRSIHGPAQSGTLDMLVQEEKYGRDREDNGPGLFPRDDALNDPFTLRGLLRDETGYFDVHVSPEQSKPLYYWGIDTRVDVSVLSSPKTINSVQEQLGRLPGIDAVILTTSEGKTHRSPGEWVESFGEGLELGVSDTSDWYEAQHDREPFDHVQSWVGSPSQFLRRAAARARVIKKEHGSKIHLAEGERPDEVDAFVDGLDKLRNFTAEPMRMMLELGYEHLPKPPLHYVYNWVNARPLTYVRLFKNLGIIAPELSGEKLVQQRWNINKMFIAHIAGICMKLDEIKPQEGVSKQTQAARTKMFQLAIEKCDPALADKL